MCLNDCECGHLLRKKSYSHAVNSMCLFVNLVVSHFGFEGRTLILIALVPGHCLTFVIHKPLFLAHPSRQAHKVSL